jgi:signal transduction histidine kinase
MLRTVAHEVRNHLNAISLFAVDLNQNREDVAVIASSVRDINILMDQPLEFANLIFGAEKKLTTEWLSLADLHRDIAVVLRKMADAKGLRFSGTVKDGLANVASDRLKLRQIALNLGTNAVKYTRSGSVSLHFSRCDTECWMLEVCDTGPGIPRQSRERIFEEFQRLPETSAGQPGAGLGLAIVRRLVELLKWADRTGKRSRHGHLFPCDPADAVRVKHVPPRAIKKVREDQMAT